MKRQKSSETVESRPKKDRILFFDIVRILCIAFIVYDHSQFRLIPDFNQLFFASGNIFFNIYTAGLAGDAVYGMIFISGAVLEYNYAGLEKLHGYAQFLFRRFVRLYPAFWMSLVVSLICFPLLWQNGLIDVLFEFTGFFIVLGQGPGYINLMGWFIAAIVSLYILFPWFSQVMRKYGFPALVGFLVISWGLRFLLTTYNLGPVELFWRWFPLCNAFEFCLGIYLVQAGLYPKTPTRSPVVRELSDMSYYVFIFHIVVIDIFLSYLLSTLGMFDVSLVSGNYPLADTIWYIQMMAGVLIVSYLVMKIDSRLQKWILQQDTVRRFLRS
ncbi:MAG: acyltransferase [Methanomicrobiales archaeon]|nr:acyltransferase [Methanomicrobiales archaeon]